MPDPGFVPGPGTLVQETAGTSWQDSPADPGSVFYKITALDHAGNESIPAESGTVTGVEETLPLTFALHGAVPNPSLGQTTIGFALPHPSAVRLELFDVTGRLVRSLADGVFPEGIYQVVWDGRDSSGRSVASGVYLYRLTADGFEATQRVMMVR